TFTVTATDSHGCTGTRTITLVIAPTSCSVITLSPASLSPGKLGTPYDKTITAKSSANGKESFTFAITSGALPPGLTLGIVGRLTGTPTAIGTSTFTVTATATSGCSGHTLQSRTRRRKRSAVMV